MTASVTRLPCYHGAPGADVLNRSTPCADPRCDRVTCRWDYDAVGGNVTRVHSRMFASGIMYSGIEFPPGDPRNNTPSVSTDLGAAAIVVPDVGDDGLTLAGAALLAADLVEAVRHSLSAPQARHLGGLLLQVAECSAAAR